MVSAVQLGGCGLGPGSVRDRQRLLKFFARLVKTPVDGSHRDAHDVSDRWRCLFLELGEQERVAQGRIEVLQRVVKPAQIVAPLGVRGRIVVLRTKLVQLGVGRARREQAVATA